MAQRKRCGRAGRTREVEVVREVVGEPVAIGERREAPVVLDESQHARELTFGMVDPPRLRVRGDHQHRHPEPVAERIDPPRGHVIVETSPLVPRDEDRRVLPHGAPHDRVDDASGPVLALAHRMLGVVRQLVLRRDPGDRLQPAGTDVAHDVVDREDVLVPPLLVVAVPAQPAGPMPQLD